MSKLTILASVFAISTALIAPGVCLADQHEGKLNAASKNADRDHGGTLHKDEATEVPRAALRFASIDSDDHGMETPDLAQDSMESAKKSTYDRDEAKFKKADKDNDGTLNKREAKAMRRVARNFDAIDVDKDGRVSLIEVHNFMENCIPKPEPTPIECTRTSGPCQAVNIANDNPTGPGPFHGYGDPTIVSDPAIQGRVWLSYSNPHVAFRPNPAGGARIPIAVVSTHLARSDDGGASFTRVATLWPERLTEDPEGTGEVGFMNSETVSLAHRTVGETTTWYSARVSYFQRPIAGYHPRYGTSLLVRVAAAEGASPEVLATAPDMVVGVATTSNVYNVNVRVNEFASELASCALVNNPDLVVKDNSLYLTIECPAFTGSAANFAESRTVVLVTQPNGLPATWQWRYAGILSDQSLAAELGGDILIQPDLAFAADGTPLALLTVATASGAFLGYDKNGCRAIELAKIDPPLPKRDCDGSLIVRASLTGAQTSSCSYDPSVTTRGMLFHAQTGDGDWLLYDSDLRP